MGDVYFLKKVIKMFRREWRVEGFTLRYHTPENFTRCHWQKTERVLPMWIVYRTFLVLYFTSSLLYTVLPIADPVADENREKYLIFLTHWTYLVEYFQFLLGFIIVVMKATEECQNSSPAPMEKMPWYYQMYWLFFTIALSTSILVTLLFWSTIYYEKPHSANFACFIEHLFNSFFMIIDFWLVGHPVKFLHFYIPSLYALTYVIFSLIYYLCGGKGVEGLNTIDGILDWSLAFPTILNCCFCWFFLLFIHFMFGCFSLCKFCIKNSPESVNEQ